MIENPCSKDERFTLCDSKMWSVYLIIYPPFHVHTEIAHKCSAHLMIPKIKLSVVYQFANENDRNFIILIYHKDICL